MSATILPVLPGGKERKVKNLGWLLRHWKSVGSFDVTLPVDSVRGVTLTAHLHGHDKGYIFVVDFADRSVLWNFLNRPVFAGVTVTWLDGNAYQLAKRVTFDQVKPVL